MSQPDTLVEVVAVKSGCSKIKEGSRIVLRGPMLDPSSGEDVCMTAMVAIYPFIVAARAGGTIGQVSEDGSMMAQCQDVGESVVFRIRRM